VNFCFFFFKFSSVAYNLIGLVSPDHFKTIEYQIPVDIPESVVFSFIWGRGKKLFLLHSIQTGPGAHPASYPMGAGGSFLGKQPGCEADILPPSSVDVKNSGAIPPLPYTSYGHGA
jgi:hypothetical protein